MMMYNLEVAQDHTFTVGSGQWIVHNCDNTLYRVLRSGEDPAAGLVAKDPSASISVKNHIFHGSNPGFASQFISTTKSLDVAAKYAARDGLRIAAIDSTKVEGDVIDVSTKEGLLANGIEHPSFAYSWARSSAEVLIRGAIPSEAILWVSAAGG
jgi:hypothetical protein